MSLVRVICTDKEQSFPREWIPVDDKTYVIRVPFTIQELTAYLALKQEELQRKAANVAAYFEDQHIVNMVSAKVGDVQLSVPIARNKLDSLKLNSAEYFHLSRNIDFNVRETPVGYHRGTKSLYVATVQPIDPSRRREYHYGQYVPSNVVIKRISSKRHFEQSNEVVVGTWELPVWCYYHPSDVHLIADDDEVFGFVVQFSRERDKTYKCIVGKPLEPGSLPKDDFVRPIGLDDYTRTKVGKYYSYQKDATAIIANASGNIILKLKLDDVSYTSKKVIYVDDEKLIIQLNCSLGSTSRLYVHHYGELNDEQRANVVKLNDLFMVDTNLLSHYYHLIDDCLMGYTHDWKSRAGRMYVTVLDLVTLTVE